MISIEKLLQYHCVDPNNKEIALTIIEVMAGSGDIDGAFEFLTSFDCKQNNDYRFKAWHAHLYMAQLKFEKAICIYESMFENGIDNESLKINCAYAQLHCGRHTSALELLNECSSENLEYHILKVRCMSSQEDLSEAIKILTSLDCSFSSEKLKSEKMGLLSLLYLDDANYSKAKCCAKESLMIDNSNFDAKLVMSTLDLFRMDIAKATLNIDMLYEEYSNVGRVIVLKALLEMYSNNIELAVDLYEKACDFMPFHVGSKINLAWCYFLEGNLISAENKFKESIELDENFAEGYGGMSLVMAKQGLWQDSKKMSKIALRLDGMCASALFSRALYLKNIGKGNESQLIINGLVAFSSETTDKTIKDIVLERINTG